MGEIPMKLEDFLSTVGADEVMTEALKKAFALGRATLAHETVASLIKMRIHSDHKYLLATQRGLEDVLKQGGI